MKKLPGFYTDDGRFVWTNLAGPSARPAERDDEGKVISVNEPIIKWVAR